MICPLTVSLHCGDEVSIQEQVHIGEIGGGSSVHHHLVQNLKHTHRGKHIHVLTSAESSLLYKSVTASAAASVDTAPVQPHYFTHL